MPKVLNSPRLKYQSKKIHVWNGHGLNSETGNVSARLAAALRHWTATDKRWNKKVVIYPFINANSKRTCCRDNRTMELNVVIMKQEIF